jgi:hypothetical protein
VAAIVASKRDRYAHLTEEQSTVLRVEELEKENSALKEAIRHLVSALYDHLDEEALAKNHVGLLLAYRGNRATVLALVPKKKTPMTKGALEVTIAIQGGPIVGPLFLFKQSTERLSQCLTMFSSHSKRTSTYSPMWVASGSSPLLTCVRA